MPEPASLDRDIAAYMAMQERYESEYLGQWIVVFDEKAVGVYASFEEAGEAAFELFGDGPYLIRRIGERTANLPDSIIFGH
ncbi:MAG: hypothetical protein Q8R82_00735 [Hyphomonadaceae bacterium]|nr:hypothetical protein [Hyphomonadaceae bacterium]